MERDSVRDWSGRKVLVIGAARQGLALTSYLVRHAAQVILNDQRPEQQLAVARAELESGIVGFPGSIRCVFGAHPLDLLEQVDLVCVSGGVPLSLPLVSEARRLGLPLSNDSQILLEAVPCRVVGITGSAGKTTTTTLVGRIADQSGRWNKVWVGGNIGLPLIEFVDDMSSTDLAVIELSSFQLELMSRSPDVAAILNITPNHLDRHGTMAAYTAAKARILDFQPETTAAVLGRDDPGAWSLLDRVHGRMLSFGLAELPESQEGTFLRDDVLCLRLAGQPDQEIMSRNQVRLRGEHNLLNVLAASAIASASGIPASAIPAGVQEFNGVAHRLEFVRLWGGAEWYNDSIATAPERVIAAIHSFDEPLILLVGGRDKKLPWDEFARLVHRRVDHLIVFGEAADLILAAMQAAAVDLQNQPQSVQQSQKLTITRCDNLAGAVQAAAGLVQPGDVVLLSPGGTSFDEFRDFEERGECFAKMVKELP